MKVLVTTYKTASDRIALAAIRGLSLAGYEPWLGTDDRATATSRSRHCRGVVTLPNPISHTRHHVAGILEHIRTHRFDTVLPTDDYAVFALSQAVETRELDTPVAVPPLASQQMGMDKARMTQLASEIGLHVPETQKVTNQADLEHALNHIPSPWVIKPNQGGGSVGLLVSEDKKEVLDHVNTFPRYADAIFDFKTLLVQNFIPGRSADAYALMRRGSLIRSMASRRLLSWPAENGSGLLAETISKPCFFDGAIELLETLDWHGPANVEFRIDRRDGKAYFIEVNGRLWGTSALAIAAGVNFPAVACQMVIDNDLPPEIVFPAGVCMRFPFPLGLSLFASSPKKAAIGWQLFGPSLRCKSEFWWTDPIPGLLYLRDGIVSVWSGQAARELSPLSIARSSSVE